MSLAKCGCSIEQVDLMFKKAEQYIDEQIADRSYRKKNYWATMFPVKGFPDGVGLKLDKVRFFGDIGPQYDGFNGWRKVEMTRDACAAALKGEHDGCGHVWEEVGHGMETVTFEMLQRDLWTKPICIKDIRNFFQYARVQDLIYEQLTQISLNMREQLNRNAAYGFAIKHVALPNLPYNTSNPRALPTIAPGVEVGRLTYQLLLSLYHPYAQEAAEFSIAELNGMPMFGVVAHPETLNDMVYLDPDIRQDLRWCQGTSCQLITQYNFLDSMGPFVLMPNIFTPRYNRDANGVLYRVFPYERDVPIEIGTRPVTNPEYHTAEFELVLIMTRDPFCLRVRDTLTSVGGMTEFDPEVPLFQWKWHNPPGECRPYRRVGRYVTTAEVGIEPGDFVDYPAILVKRKPGYTGIAYWGPEVCPPTPVNCSNTLTSQGCPCPQVVSVSRAVAGNELIFVFDRSIGAIPTETVSIETIGDAGYLTGEVVEIDTTGTVVRIQFINPVPADPNYWTQLMCNPVGYCSSKVIGCSDCRSVVTDAVDVNLVRALVANTPADVVIAYFGDGSSAEMTVVSADTSRMIWQLRYNVGFGPTDDPDGDGANIPLTYDIICDRKGIKYICVPTSTDANCPACGTTFEVCGDGEAVDPSSLNPCPCGTTVVARIIEN